VVGVVQQPSGKKKKIRLIDVWVVETLICVHRLSLLLLLLKWPACSVFSGKFRRYSGEAPASFQ
jgi:hypothetical protein